MGSVMVSRSYLYSSQQGYRVPDIVNMVSRSYLYSSQQEDRVPDTVIRSYLYSSVQGTFCVCYQLVVLVQVRLARFRQLNRFQRAKSLELIRCYCISRQVFTGNRFSCDTGTILCILCIHATGIRAVFLELPTGDQRPTQFQQLQQFKFLA